MTDVLPSNRWLGRYLPTPIKTSYARKDLMIVFNNSRKVNRSAEETFDVIGTHLYDNHPLWETEVVEIRPITPGPVGVGSRAVMVRREFGRTTESEYVITEFEPGKGFKSHHPDDGMDFNISFDITPIDDESCTVHVKAQAELQGWMRLLEPLMRLVMPKRAARIADDMKEVIETASVRT